MPVDKDKQGLIGFDHATSTGNSTPLLMKKDSGENFYVLKCPNCNHEITLLCSDTACKGYLDKISTDYFCTKCATKTSHIICPNCKSKLVATDAENWHLEKEKEPQRFQNNNYTPTPINPYQGYPNPLKNRSRELGIFFLASISFILAVLSSSFYFPDPQAEIANIPFMTRVAAGSILLVLLIPFLYGIWILVKKIRKK